MANTEVIIRDGELKDCNEILTLIKELAVFENEPESIVTTTAETLVRDGFGKDKWFMTVVAEEITSTSEKRLVGFALFFRTYSTWTGRTFKMEDLYVKQDFRGKGIGTRLLKGVASRAMKEGCARVHWCVLEWNEPAKNFYKKLDVDYQEEWRVCIWHKKEIEKLDL